MKAVTIDDQFSTRKEQERKSVDSGYSTCWDFASKGLCPRGSACSWIHCVSSNDARPSASTASTQLTTKKYIRPWTGDSLPVRTSDSQEEQWDDNQPTWNVWSGKEPWKQEWKQGYENSNTWGNAQASTRPRQENGGSDKSYWSSSWKTNEWAGEWNRPRGEEKNDTGSYKTSEWGQWSPGKQQQKYRPRKENKDKKGAHIKKGEIYPERTLEMKQAAKSAVNAKIDFILKECTNFQKMDFDFRVRRFLYALHAREGQQRFEEAVEFIRTTTSNKDRKEINNWSAYILTLLKKFQPDLLNRDSLKKEEGKSEKKLLTTEEVAAAIMKLLVDNEHADRCPFTKKEISAENLGKHSLDLLRQEGHASAHLLGFARDQKIKDHMPGLLSSLLKKEERVSSMKKKDNMKEEEEKEQGTEQSREKEEGAWNDASFHFLIEDKSQPDTILQEVALRLFLEVVRGHHVCPVGIQKLVDPQGAVPNESSG